MTPSEELVARLCRKTFLSLWSYPTPKRVDNGRELCDLLVISDPYVIIYSVKEITIKDSGNYEVDVKRWLKRAIDKSCEQIYGAERALQRNVKIVDQHGREIINLPKYDKDKIFRIGVAIGRGNRFPLSCGDFGKGFVHIFDEKSLQIIHAELDTIADFIDYLKRKETLFKLKRQVPLKGEEDLLAVYLHNGRQFPANFDLMILDGNLWDAFTKKKEFIKRKEEDKISYIWDGIIEEFCHDFREGSLCFDTYPEGTEKALRVMAKENRFSRRILSSTFLEFIGYYGEPKSRARIVKAQSGIVYVFLVSKRDECDREFRRAELGLRCFIARGMHREVKIVVGIATEEYKKGAGHSYDLCYLEKRDWTDEDQKKMLQLQEEFGYFKNPEISKKGFDEFPTK